MLFHLHEREQMHRDMLLEMVDHHKLNTRMELHYLLLHQQFYRWHQYFHQLLVHQPQIEVDLLLIRVMLYYQ